MLFRSCSIDTNMLNDHCVFLFLHYHHQQFLSKRIQCSIDTNMLNGHCSILFLHYHRQQLLSKTKSMFNRHKYVKWSLFFCFCITIVNSYCPRRIQCSIDTNMLNGHCFFFVFALQLSTVTVQDEIIIQSTQIC